MAVIYLEPQDLTPAQTVLVLEYLNTVQTAADIAARIEFPGEPDIGIRLGQRLLAARTALGGRYSNLEQVAALPLIGPERFTEICVGLLGIDPRVSLRNLSLLLEDQLSRVERLREEFERLQQASEQVCLELTVEPQPAWLGQKLDLTLTATDAAGRPLINRSITVETNAGLLESAVGFAVQRSSALTLSTGADGTIRFGLRPAAIEPLTGAQEAALEDALGLLDARATSPNLIKSQFLDLVALYESEREHAFRRAVDIYVRNYKTTFLDRLNADNLGFEWPMESSLVRAAGHPEAGGTRTLSHAVVVVRWKNWVGAWLDALAGHLAGRSKLGAAFNAAKQRGAMGYRLVDSLLGEAHSFIADQRGLSGEWVSQRVVKDEIGQFLGDGLEGVDDVTRRELFAHLEVAAEQLTPRHRGAIGMVAQTRIDIADRIETVDSNLTRQLGDFRLETVRLAEQINLVKGDIGAIQVDIGTLRTDFDAIEVDFEGVRGDVGIIREDMSTVRIDLGDVKTDIGTVKIDLGKLRPGGG